MLYNVQDKPHNNRIATAGYLNAEVNKNDCIMAGDSYYIGAVPEGVIVLGAMMQLTDQCDEDVIKFDIQIGEGDCKMCENEEEYTLTGSELLCEEFCKCKVTDEQKVIKLTVNEYPEGSRAGIKLMLHILSPEHFTCQVPDYKLDINAFVEPACKTNSCKKC